MKVLSLFAINMAMILIGEIVVMEGTLVEKMIVTVSAILSMVIAATAATRESLYSYTVIDFERNKSSYGISTIKNINKNLYWADHCVISSILLLISILCMLAHMFVEFKLICTMVSIASLICFVAEAGVAIRSILDFRHLFTNCKVNCKLCMAMYIIPVLNLCCILAARYKEKIGKDSLFVAVLMVIITVIVACYLIYYYDKLQKQYAHSLISCDAKLICTLMSGEKIKTRAHNVFLSVGDRKTVIFYYKHGLLVKEELKKLQIRKKDIDGKKNKETVLM